MKVKPKNGHDMLPKVRGKYSENEPLGRKSWFGCGGAADVLFKPEDAEDLQNFLRNCPPPLSSPLWEGGGVGGGGVFVLGALSNTIIRDGGLPGVTIRLGKGFGAITVEGDTITAGAQAMDFAVARAAAEAGIGGLEFLTGIPGSIGGALKMNAGCYGTEMKDVLVSATALDGRGNLHTLTPEDMKMSYRHTDVPEDFIFIAATLKGVKENPDTVLKRMEEIKSKREASQPIREKTGGSTFANPDAVELSRAGLPEDTKVWQLIDKVGGRGLTIGGAKMSEKHCNFMINAGDACAADLEALGEELRKRVLETFGLTLRWEIKRIGRKGNE